MIKVTILNYLRKVKISDSRMPQYYGLRDKLPEKYQNNKRYVWRKNAKTEILLYDSQTRQFVISNPNSVGTPSYQAIAGNEIYARMHERKRMKVIDALKAQFKENLRNVDIPQDYFPLSVSMELRAQFGYAEWDLDNLWIYHKCFLDSLTDLGIIEDDNVLYIRQAGQTTFIPIREGETPSMTFIFTKAPEVNENEKIRGYPLTLYEAEGKAGDVEYDLLHSKVTMFTGKKRVIYGAAKKCIREIMLHCLNNFKTLFVKNSTYERYKAFFDENRFNNEVKIIITPDNE
jgi:hypothetical protein